MARFNIISKDGIDIRFSGKPRYIGSYLKPSYIEFSEIASHGPIAWEVGDYVDYPRTGMRYRLYSIPQPSKNARKNTHGRAFTYSNVQFHAATKELEIALFRDLVSNDNNIHFSTSPDVATFEDVYGIARRIQACMDDLYPNRWEIRVADFDATEDSDIIEKITEAKDFALSGGTCLDALSKIYELWQDIGWIHTHEEGKEVITIGYANKRIDANTTDAYLYGKANGLTAIKKIQTNKDEFATRLYVYGSERNLPSRYYNDKDIFNAESVDIRNLMIPLDSWGKTGGLPDARKSFIENADVVAKYGVVPKTHYFDHDDAGSDIYPSISGMTIGMVRNALVGMGTMKYYPDENIYLEDSDRVDEIQSVINPADDGVLKQGGKQFEEVKELDISGQGSFSISSATWTREFTIAETSFAKSGTGEVSINPNMNIAVVGLNLQSVKIKFDLADNDSIVFRSVVDSKTVSGTSPEEGSSAWLVKIPSLRIKQNKNGKFPVYLTMRVEITTEDTTERNITIRRPSNPLEVRYARVLDSVFTLRLKQVGFDIDKQASLGEGKVISMKTGACAGRNFEISSCIYLSESDSWELACKRQQDDTLGMLFPNADFPIVAKDRFVLLEIAMPESYIRVASERLFAEGQKLYAMVSKVQNHYEPAIDAKVMAESGRALREGMFMEISDDDIVDGGTEYILIDTLSIYEDEDAIPTYKVTLKERRKVKYKGTPSATAASKTKSVEEEESVESDSASSLWYLDADGNLVTDKQVIIKNNAQIEGDTVTGGTGQNTPASGTVTGVSVNGVKYTDVTAGILDLSAAFNNVTVDLSDYYTKKEIDGKIAGIDLSPYAKTTDVANTYATKGALSALQTSHDALKAEFDALESALNDDVSGKINTWNEIVDFLDEYSGSQDLAAILSGINADIAKRALQSDLSALTKRVTTAEGSIVSLGNNKADKATTLAGYGITDAYTRTQIDASVASIIGDITAVSGRVSTIETWKDSLSKYITIEDGNVKISTNLIVTGDTVTGGEGEDTPASGTVTGVLVGTTKYESVSGGLLDLTTLMGLYTPLSSYNGLASRVTALEGKATAVSFTQTLTNGTKIGAITIDGESKNIYSPTIPTSLKNPYSLTIFNSEGLSSIAYDGSEAKSLTITKAWVGLGNVTNLAASGYLTALSSNATNAVSITVGGTTKNITSAALKSSLGLGALAYKSSLVASDIPALDWSKITSGKPTSLGGYGITDAVSAPNGPTGTSIQTYCAGNPSLLAMVQINGMWTHVISQRHRNGASDGNSYGLYLSADYVSSHLVWERQNNGAWQGQRVILDSVSYTDYTYSKSSVDAKLSGYLPLSGGNVTSLTVGGYAAIHSGNIGSQSVNHANSAAQLSNSGTIWGQSFNGSGDVSGALSGATTIVASSVICGTGSLRVNASDSAGNFGYIRVETVASNRGLLHLGANYGGSTDVTNTSVRVDALGLYRGVVGVGRTYTYDELYANHSAGISLQVDKSLKVGASAIIGTSLEVPYMICGGQGVGCYFGAASSGIGAAGGGLVYTYGSMPLWFFVAGASAMSIGSDRGVTIENYAHIKGGLTVGATYSADGASGTAGVTLRSEGGIELSHATTPYIDFHLKNATTDYSNRLICDTLGRLQVMNNFRVTGTAWFQSTAEIDGTLSASAILPRSHNTYSLGSASQSWQSVYLVSSNNRASGQDPIVINDSRTTAGYQAIRFLRNGADYAALQWFHDGFNSSSYTWNKVSCINLDTAAGGAITLGAWSSPQVIVDKASGNTTINGNLIVSGDTATGSDVRFKDILRYMVLDIDDIAKAPLFIFKWKGRQDDSVHLGTGAQYWETVTPWLVRGEDFKHMDYATLGVSMGISLARKTLDVEDRVKALEKKVKEVEQENTALKAEIRRIRNGR